MEQRQALVSGMAALVADARVVVPTRPVALCRDPGDDMVLECDGPMRQVEKGRPLELQSGAKLFDR